mmetsp:Transcript_24543/g.72969  ORF Transcript_24543/g.72969 Transcript_24543/m.72969 type:complete len:219 (+) Transcript_24543:85-741(+)
MHPRVRIERLPQTAPRSGSRPHHSSSWPQASDPVSARTSTEREEGAVEAAEAAVEAVVDIEAELLSVSWRSHSPRALSSAAAFSACCLSNFCTRMRDPSTSCSGPAASTSLTEAAAAICTNPRLLGRRRAWHCGSPCWRTVECATSTRTTVPYAEKCCFSFREALKPNLFMRRTMKRQSGSSLVSSCKLVDRVWTPHPGRPAALRPFSASSRPAWALG